MLSSGVAAASATNMCDDLNTTDIVETECWLCPDRCGFGTLSYTVTLEPDAALSLNIMQNTERALHPGQGHMRPFLEELHQPLQLENGAAAALR